MVYLLRKVQEIPYPEPLLVGGCLPTNLKNMLVKLDRFSKDRGEHKKCLSCHHPVW